MKFKEKVMDINTLKDKIQENEMCKGVIYGIFSYFS